jgi:RNA polymerase sigma-70 factor (ECF subfamily)
MADQDRPGDPETSGRPIRHTDTVTDLTVLTIRENAASSPRDAEHAIATAFELYHTEVYSFLRRTTRDEHAAEDLLQEAFVRLFNEVRIGRPPDNIRAWLYRVASNLAIDRGRRRLSVVRFLAAQPQDTNTGPVADSPEADVIRRERRRDLEAVLATLPPEARTALLLSSEGFSGEEIAVAIGRTHAATRTLLVRARRRMRAALGEREARP